MHEREFSGANFQGDITVSIFDEGRYRACYQNSFDTTGDILNIEWQVTLASFCVAKKINYTCNLNCPSRAAILFPDF